MYEMAPVEGKITLHGLGFIVVQLSEVMRLHVWHPDLPRRKSFEETKIHDHRFAFQSQVLVGEMRNTVWNHSEGALDLYQMPMEAYTHDGPRRLTGNRPWNYTGLVNLAFGHSQLVSQGHKYAMPANVFHDTRPLGDGRVATLMTKLSHDGKPARSLAVPGTVVDKDFDRYQLPEPVLWSYVLDVLSGETTMVAYLKK